MNDRLISMAVGLILLAASLSVNLAVAFPDAQLQFTLRVLLSLGAALVGGALTGYLGFESPPIRAGGGMALFVIVFLINPPGFIQHQKVDRLVAPAEAALQSGNLSRAEDLFAEASDRAPDLWEPNWGLGKVAFRTGNFAEALAQSRKVIEKKEQFGETVLPQDRYQVALALDGIGDTAAALEVLSDIVRTAQPTTNVFTDAIFDIGLLNLNMALKEPDEEKRKQLLDAARAGFAGYAKAEKNTTEWYHYHLACMAASFGNSDAEKESALSEFKQAIDEIKQLPPDLSRYQAQIMRDTLSGSYQRQPGYPAYCPALVELVRQHYATLESIFGA